MEKYGKYSKPAVALENLRQKFRFWRVQSAAVSTRLEYECVVYYYHERVLVNSTLCSILSIANTQTHVYTHCNERRAARCLPSNSKIN